MFDSIYQFLDRIGYPHPIHPTEVHMPIGLIVGALVFRIAAMLFRRPALAQAAHYCTILAFIFLFPTILFGFMDWQHFYAGAWLHPIKIKLFLAAVLIAWISAGLFIAYKRGIESRFVMLNYSVSFLLVVVLGYFGGDLVYGGERPKAPESYLAGMKVFNENCAACHPKGGNVVHLSDIYPQSQAAGWLFRCNACVQSKNDLRPAGGRTLQIHHTRTGKSMRCI